MLLVMKIVVILFFLLLPRCDGVSNEMKTVINLMSDSIGNLVLECRGEMHFAEDVIDDMLVFWDDKKELKSFELGCALKCVFKKLDIFDEGGDLKRANFDTFAKAMGAGKWLNGRVTDLLKLCKQATRSYGHYQDTNCKSTMEFTRCVRYGLFQLQSSPQLPKNKNNNSGQPTYSDEEDTVDVVKEGEDYHYNPIPSSIVANNDKTQQNNGTGPVAADESKSQQNRSPRKPRLVPVNRLKPQSAISPPVADYDEGGSQQYSAPPEPVAVDEGASQQNNTPPKSAPPESAPPESAPLESVPPESAPPIPVTVNEGVIKQNKEPPQPVGLKDVVSQQNNAPHPPIAVAEGEKLRNSPPHKLVEVDDRKSQPTPAKPPSVAINVGKKLRNTAMPRRAQNNKRKRIKPPPSSFEVYDTVDRWYALAAQKRQRQEVPTRRSGSSGRRCGESLEVYEDQNEQAKSNQQRSRPQGNGKRHRFGNRDKNSRGFLSKIENPRTKFAGLRERRGRNERWRVENQRHEQRKNKFSG